MFFGHGRAPLIDSGSRSAIIAKRAPRRTGRVWARRMLLSGLTTFVDRLRPLTPPAAWSSLLALRSAAGRGPVFTRPAADRALVLAPHPDDETIGCGGCVALLAEEGTDVRVLAASSGEASTASPSRSARKTAQSRASDLEAACSILGATVEDVLALPDGDLSNHEDAIALSIGNVLARFRPDVVFVPWPLDDHPDHLAVCRALAASTGLQASTKIWCYEVWSALTPNRMVDISPWWDQKNAALQAHAKSAGSSDLTAHLALNRWRSIVGLSGVGQVEAYLVLSPKEFCRLVEASR
jgi:LmbE family N-acetylglucosaminyl deacetylase